MSYGEIKKQIIENFNIFPKKELMVAKYITDNYDNILHMTLKELSAAIGVSEATVVRFAKSLGYTGFYPFRTALKEEAGAVRSPYMLLKQAKTPDDVSLKAYLDNVMCDIRVMFDRIDLGQIEKNGKENAGGGYCLSGGRRVRQRCYEAYE